MQIKKSATIVHNLTNNNLQYVKGYIAINERWVTMSGARVLIDDDGTILAGMDGKYDGMSLDQAFGDDNDYSDMDIEEALVSYMDPREYLDMSKKEQDAAKVVIADGIVDAVGDEDYSGQIDIYRGVMLHELPEIGEDIEAMSWTDHSGTAEAFATGEEDYEVYRDADERPIKAMYRSTNPRLSATPEMMGFDVAAHGFRNEGEIFVHPSERGRITDISFDDDREIYIIDVRF